MSKPTNSRRGFLKKTAYVAPAILTLTAAPSFAKSGSEKYEKPEDSPKPPKKTHN